MGAPYYKKKKGKGNVIDNNYVPKGSNEILSIKIEEFGLNPKTVEVLLNGKLQTVRDIAIRTEKDLFKIQNFNKRSLFDIQKVFSSKGLELKPMPEVVETHNNQGVQTNEQKANMQTNKPNALDSTKVDNQTRTNANQQNTQNKKNTFKEIINDSIIKANNDKLFKGNKPKENDRNKNNQFKDNRNNNQNRDNRNNKKAAPQPKVKEVIDKNALIKYISNGKYGYKNYAGQTIIPAMYSEIFAFKEGLACVEIDELYGYINMQNEMVIPADKYVSAMSFSEGLAAVLYNEKYGYINQEGEVVIDYMFDAATAFEDGKAKVKQDGKWGIINKEGKINWNIKQ